MWHELIKRIDSDAVVIPTPRWRRAASVQPFASRPAHIFCNARIV
jgi:hypothetical protein